ncbi:hypothetical protein [Chryseobacterium gleum]|uniref:hypothetical protein n=1 Tax=Chryseobacterium gleum TaxID=250 RepID=UPI002899D237|nr:hypothetical protein [Chryseobacterium gleum]
MASIFWDMLINSENGVIKLETFSTGLYKGMSLDQLKQSDFYREKYNDVWDVKTGYFWYYFKPIEIQGYQVSFSLCFFENQLDIVHMNTWENGDAKDWSEWTEEKEMNVFYRNNTFLTKILNRSPTQKKKNPYPSCTFKFSWGNVWSVYDPRSAASLMGIYYNEEEKQIK